MIRFAACIGKAHAFALWHRRKLTEPDKKQFHEDWKTFTARLKARPENWTDAEFSVMLTYASAALRYDPPNHGTTWTEWATGGLWAKQWGSMGASEPAQDHAA
jgi:hypothetical protein